EISTGEVGSRLDEPFRVERNATAQPAGTGLGPGHQEHVPDIMARDFAGAVAPPHPFQAPVSFERDDLGSRPDVDRRILFDAANEGPRHGRGETVRADEDVHLPTPSR